MERTPATAVRFLAVHDVVERVGMGFMYSSSR
jgi:hypothetical protein